MDYPTLAMLFLFLGLSLIFAEIFIPSAGTISTLVVLCLIGSVTSAWLAWGTSYPLYFWSFLAGEAVLIPIVLVLAFYIWPMTPIGRQAILEAPKSEDVTPFQELEQRLRQLVGRVGETATALNPAGIVKIDGERLHCQSEGGVLDPRVSVRVMGVQGNALIVRKLDPGESASPRVEIPSSLADTPPADFEEI